VNGDRACGWMSPRRIPAGRPLCRGRRGALAKLAKVPGRRTPPRRRRLGRPGGVPGRGREGKPRSLQSSRRSTSRRWNPASCAAPAQPRSPAAHVGGQDGGFTRGLLPLGRRLHDGSSDPLRPARKRALKPDNFRATRDAHLTARFRGRISRTGVYNPYRSDFKSLGTPYHCCHSSHCGSVAVPAHSPLNDGITRLERRGRLHHRPLHPSTR
jgi:hypothetical protein